MNKGRKTDNFILKVWLETVQSIVGPNGLKSILNYAHIEKYIDSFPPDNDSMEIPLEELQKLNRSLLELFGQKGAHTLQIRVGREFSKLGLEGRPRVTKPIKVAARLLPESKRISFLLEKTMENIKQRFSYPDGSSYEIKEDEDAIILIDRAWFESDGISSKKPVCGFFTGMLYNGVEWITGHPHKVEEIECRAMGHPANVFRISKVREE